MANRHLARSVVMQTLFEWDFAKRSREEAFDILKRNKEEFAPGVTETSFMDGLLETVLDKQKDIDSIITKAAPDWPIEKISVIDRNILRLGLSELLFSDTEQVPPKVAINEAIELAKSFGGETSGKFVNGVLGAVYKEMGEPGKDEVSVKKKTIKNIPDDKLTIEDLGGALVYSIYEGVIYLALVHDVFGHWTLSKGKLENGESVKEGTTREIKEEIGIDITIEEDLGTNEYIAFHPEKGKLKKRVHYFLAKADFQPLTLEAHESRGGLTDAQWFPVEKIGELNFYDDIIPLVTKGIEMMGKKE
jgi:transcription antitermination protein NusB